MQNLSLRMAIYTNVPMPPCRTGAETVTCQLWIGGATDWTRRTMIEEPQRWLMLVETDPTAPQVLAPDGSLLSWELDQINSGGRPSPTNAPGLVLSSMDIDESVGAEFNDWYDTEHFPVLAKLPGMLAARRFRARHGSPRYVALYHVTDLSIYSEPSWCA